MGETFIGRRDFAFSNLVAGLQERVRLAKQGGKIELEVMNIPEGDCIRGLFGFRYSLGGLSKLVFSYCEKRGFKPRVVNGEGRRASRKIVIPC